VIIASWIMFDQLGIDEELSTRTSKKSRSSVRLFPKRSISPATRIIRPHGARYAASIGGDVGSFITNLWRTMKVQLGMAGVSTPTATTRASRYLQQRGLQLGGRTTDGGAHEVNFGNYYKPGCSLDVFLCAQRAIRRLPRLAAILFYNNVMPGHFTEPINRRAASHDRNGGYLPTNYSSWAARHSFRRIGYPICHECLQALLSDVGCTQPQIDDTTYADPRDD